MLFRLVENRRVYFMLSGTVILVGLLAMLFSFVTTGAPFGVGVDFSSGTRFELQFTEPVSETAVRDVFTDFGINNPAVIKLSGEGFDNAYQVRSEFVNTEDAVNLLKAAPSLNIDGSSYESVSPTVGKEVSRAALIAVVVAALVILVYIMWSFRTVSNPFRYGACAVSALLHDILITLGFMAIMGLIFGWEVDQLFLTAILSIAGFSLQDTIVVFDRIRENVTKRPLEKYEMIVNRSVLETISRSLATSLSTMFVMVTLIIFGGASIRQFVSVLFVGLLSGTYSSLFHAVPLLVAWEKGELPWNRKK